MNEKILTIDKKSAMTNLQEIKDQEKETGQSVLMLGLIFHEKILFIKK
jgi:hypothetical protein